MLLKSPLKGLLLGGYDDLTHCNTGWQRPQPPRTRLLHLTDRFIGVAPAHTSRRASLISSLWFREEDLLLLPYVNPSFYKI